ncbi:helix-turn-helix domain-containing protein [Chloroherpeton thalassium]|nr:AraC family transcriptional regulator [Chloroherpeton thalassium]
MIERKQIKEFILIKEQHQPTELANLQTNVQAEVYALSLYLSGASHVSNPTSEETKYGGQLYSFYANPIIEKFEHQVEANQKLEKITVLVPFEMMNAFSAGDPNIARHVAALSESSHGYVKGVNYQLTPQILEIGHQIFNHKYAGSLADMFLESQVLALLVEHFTQIGKLRNATGSLSNSDVEKLRNAKELLLSKLENPPSLIQLAKAANLNTFKLKTGFKELFGMPVYKYLQKERMKKAFELLEAKQMNVQEIAWRVGYSSLSSFSNSFLKMYGVRPSEILGEKYS